jgi:hypothetical protein
MNLKNSAAASFRRFALEEHQQFEIWKTSGRGTKTREEFVKEDVAPETEKRTAQFLRGFQLTEAAAWIKRGTRRARERGRKPPPQS